MHYPGLEIAQGIVQIGTNTRPRNEKEMIELYQRAIASTVIATAKEALAYAPAANEAYVVVLRYDMRGRFSKKTTRLDAIYAGALGRGLLKIDWKTRSPVELMLGARAVRVNKDRKGRFRPLGDESGDDLRGLVSAITAITQSASHERPRRRRVTREQSRELMRSQRQEPFVAVCACPACGEIDTHALRPADTDDPEWAGVIRTCAACDRQWAQA